MALSGSFYGTTNNTKIKPKITWQAVQNLEENYSDVTATLTYSRTNTGYTTGGTWTGSVTIGDSKKEYSGYIKITHNSNSVALTHTARIYHDDYGDCTVKISAAGGITYPSSASLKTTAIAQEVTLDNIPRASEISCSDANIGACATVVITKKSKQYSHAVGFSFGGLSGYLTPQGQIAAEPVVFTQTTVNFALPESFYYEIPNEASGVCALVCTTYHDQEVIGKSQLTTFTVRAAKEFCAPVITASIEDINPKTLAVTGDKNLLVAGVSTALCTLTSQGQKGAQIVKKTIGGVGVMEDTRQLERVPMGPVVFAATDSRGYETVFSLSPAFVPYVMLTGDAVVKRTDPTSGSATVTVSGNCYYGSLGATENVLQVCCEANGVEQTFYPTVAPDHSYRLQIPLAGLDYTRSYPLKIQVSDAVSRVERQLTVEKGIPVFHWGETDFQFCVPVDVPILSVEGQRLDDYIRAIIQGG